MSAEIFSYAFAREPGERGKTFLKFLRRSYFIKALMMLPCLPLDMVLFALSLLTRTRSSPTAAVFISTKFPTLIEHELGRAAIYIGPPMWVSIALRRRGLYVPASVAYCLLGLVSWRSERARTLASAGAIGVMRLTLRLFAKADAILLHHSDALPFARCVLAAASDLGVKSVCVQHGIFHPTSQITEVEGYLSDLNVARSHEDAAMIRAARPATKIIVESDFFLPAVEHRTVPSTDQLRVLLIGEGWHSIDLKFDEEYNKTLRGLEGELLSLGCAVTFRPHPSERSQAARMGFKVVDKLPLEDALQQADITAGYASTVLYEASSIGIPACQVAVGGHFGASLSRGDVHIHRAHCAQDIIDLGRRQSAAKVNVETVSARRQAATDRVIAAITALRGKGLG